jgi:hypothetical protein
MSLCFCGSLAVRQFMELWFYEFFLLKAFFLLHFPHTRVWSAFGSRLILVPAATPVPVMTLCRGCYVSHVRLVSSPLRWKGFLPPEGERL